MDQAWGGTDGAKAAQGRKLDWRKKMSDHVAYALLVYTALQIFVTMGQLNTDVGSTLPYFALIVLVIAIIPACRAFERRWSGLSDIEAADPGRAGAFKRDRLLLWLLAICLPLLVTGLFVGLGMLFG